MPVSRSDADLRHAPAERTEPASPDGSAGRPVGVTPRPHPHRLTRRLAAGLACACLALGATACASSRPSDSSPPSPATTTSATQASGTASASAPASSTTPSPATSAASGTPDAAAASGLGQPVTAPDCPAPRTDSGARFKAPGTVVPTIAGLQPGTDHGPNANAYPAATVQKWLEKPSTAPKGKKLVFLTFDDGPTTKFTTEEVSNLEKAGVGATFFMIAPQLQDVSPQLLTRSLNAGNALAIHSFSHNYNYLYPGRRADPAHIGCDYEWALAQARAVLGSDYATSAFRYPGGHMSWRGLAPADKVLAAKGAHWIDWNSMTGDADVQRPTTTAGYLQVVKKTIAESGNPRVVVILNHDTYGKQMTADAMPSVISWLKKQGYEFGVIA